MIRFSSVVLAGMFFSITAILALESPSGANEQMAKNTILIHGKNLTQGDSIELFHVKENCLWPSTTNTSDPSCKTPVGEGKVVEVFDDHSALVATSGVIRSSQDIIVAER